MIPTPDNQNFFKKSFQNGIWEKIWDSQKNIWTLTSPDGVVIKVGAIDSGPQENTFYIQNYNPILEQYEWTGLCSITQSINYREMVSKYPQEKNDQNNIKDIKENRDFVSYIMSQNAIHLWIFLMKIIQDEDYINAIKFFQNSLPILIQQQEVPVFFGALNRLKEKTFIEYDLESEKFTKEPNFKMHHDYNKYFISLYHIIKSILEKRNKAKENPLSRNSLQKKNINIETFQMLIENKKTNENKIIKKDPKTLTFILKKEELSSHDIIEIRNTIDDKNFNNILQKYTQEFKSIIQKEFFNPY